MRVGDLDDLILVAHGSADVLDAWRLKRERDPGLLNQLIARLQPLTTGNLRELGDPVFVEIVWATYGIWTYKPLPELCDLPAKIKAVHRRLLHARRKKKALAAEEAKELRRFCHKLAYQAAVQKPSPIPEESEP